ncbi:hypothetical protein AB0D14_39665 [Streptomyces sp. NPDC048484]|uniref:hypothetical protein n=1 Tax=Streptomyces sp. NPDC048484 TaxID=3155146 RepID=UPI0034345B5E
MRTVKSYQGQRSVTHDYWAATTAGQLSCESHLERHHAMLMDFDPQVAALSRQPFRLFWPGRRGRRGHVPDFFARLDDGGDLVVNVRPDQAGRRGGVRSHRAGLRIRWMGLPPGGSDQSGAAGERQVAGGLPAPAQPPGTQPRCSPSSSPVIPDVRRNTAAARSRTSRCSPCISSRNFWSNGSVRSVKTGPRLSSPC